MLQAPQPLGVRQNQCHGHSGQNEAALEHVGHDSDAPGMFNNFFRNALIRWGHDLRNDPACVIQAIVGCFAIGSRPGVAMLRYATNVISFFICFTLFLPLRSVTLSAH